MCSNLRDNRHDCATQSVTSTLRANERFNFLSIEPAARIAQAPTLSAQPKIAEDAITLSWLPPTANIDGSTPVNLLGYNVYRTDESETQPGNQRQLLQFPPRNTWTRISYSAKTIVTLSNGVPRNRWRAGGESQLQPCFCVTARYLSTRCA